MTVEPTMEPVDRSGCPARCHHGTNRCYRFHGCRCADARRAHAGKNAGWKARQRERRGLLSGYQLACRTQRQIRALQANGWSATALAAELGQFRTSVMHILGHETVQAATAARYDALYTKLCRRPGPGIDRWGVPNAATTRARNAGCVPPWAWHGVDLSDPAAAPWYFGWDVDARTVEVLVLRCRGQHEPLPPRITLDELALVVHEVLTTVREPAAALERGFEVTRDAAHTYVQAGGLSELQVRRLRGKVRMSSAERQRLAS
jgi:hypothetical protein